MTVMLPSGHQRIDHAEMRGITIRFPGVLANDRVDFDVKAGEIHALAQSNPQWDGMACVLTVAVVEDGKLVRTDDERESSLISSLGLPQDAEIRLGQRQVRASIAGKS